MRELEDEADLEAAYRQFGERIGVAYRDLAGTNIRHKYWPAGWQRAPGSGHSRQGRRPDCGTYSFAKGFPRLFPEVVQ